MGNIVKKVINDMKENTKTIHEINKENLAAEKAAFKERHAEITKPNADLEKVKQAKGVKAKTKQIGQNLKDGCKANSEKEKERRAEIKKFENLKKENRK